MKLLYCQECNDIAARHTHGRASFREGNRRDEVSEFHPVQIDQFARNPQLPSEVTLRAYEVYCHLYGEQPAMVDLAGRGCRGGFGAGELIAFLYARSFPQTEWRTRFEEALRVKRP